MCLHVSTDLPRHAQGGQRTTCGSQFSSAVWVSVIKLRKSIHLGDKCLYLRSHLFQILAALKIFCVSSFQTDFGQGGAKWQLVPLVFLPSTLLLCRGLSYIRAGEISTAQILFSLLIVSLLYGKWAEVPPHPQVFESTPGHTGSGSESLTGLFMSPEFPLEFWNMWFTVRTASRSCQLTLTAVSSPAQGWFTYFFIQYRLHFPAFFWWGAHAWESR